MRVQAGACRACTLSTTWAVLGAVLWQGERRKLVSASWLVISADHPRSRSNCSHTACAHLAYMHDVLTARAPAEAGAGAMLGIRQALMSLAAPVSTLRVVKSPSGT